MGACRHVKTSLHCEYVDLLNRWLCCVSKTRLGGRETCGTKGVMMLFHCLGPEGMLNFQEMTRAHTWHRGGVVLKDRDVFIQVCTQTSAAMVPYPLAVRRDEGVVVVRAQFCKLREVPLIPRGSGAIVQVCNLPECMRNRWSCMDTWCTHAYSTRCSGVQHCVQHSSRKVA